MENSQLDLKVIDQAGQDINKGLQALYIIQRAIFALNEDSDKNGQRKKQLIAKYNEINQSHLIYTINILLNEMELSEDGYDLSKDAKTFLHFMLFKLGELVDEPNKKETKKFAREYGSCPKLSPENILNFTIEKFKEIEGKDLVEQNQILWLHLIYLSWEMNGWSLTKGSIGNITQNNFDDVLNSQWIQIAHEYWDIMLDCKARKKSGSDNLHPEMYCQAVRGNMERGAQSFRLFSLSLQNAGVDIDCKVSFEGTDFDYRLCKSMQNEFLKSEQKNPAIVLPSFGLEKSKPEGGLRYH